MKLLFVIDSLGSGGAQRLFVNIVNGLSTWHKSTVFLYNAESDFFKSDLSPVIPVHRLKRRARSGFSFEVVRNLKHLMDDAEVVISFLPTANIYCSIVGILSRQPKHIACEMSVVNETESRFRRLLANLANYCSRHVICNSFAQAGYVRELPYMANKVSSIWNGCADLPFALRPPRDIRSLSIVVIGRVAYPKNGVRLLQALQIFFERNGFVPLVKWVGRDDSDERARMMKQQMLDFLHKHPAVSERFRFVGEISNIGALYADSDALILPSIYEGVPVVICEAMLSGCPVVATNVADNEMILGSNEERGFMCNPLSPLDICLAIERRSSMSAEALERMTRDARSFAEENFLVPKMVDGYRHVIDSVTK
jgi:glycosyltransferase involved in cell wall biosynthesis